MTPRNIRRSITALHLAASSRRDGVGRPAGRPYTSTAAGWTRISIPSSGPGDEAPCGDALLGGKGITDDVTESLVREWLRNHQSKAYCSRSPRDSLERTAHPLRAIAGRVGPHPVS